MKKCYLFETAALRLAVLAILSVTALFWTSGARADLFLDPYAGLEMGTASGDSTAGTFKATATGPHLGARFGFAIPLIFAALDYDYGALSSSVDAPFQGGSLTRSSLFAEIGLKIPMLRAYLGYGLLNDWTFKGSASGQDLKLKGTAVKAGLGFSGLPFVVVWLDYMMSTFNKSSAGAVEEDIGSGHSFKSATASSLMLTVSLPIEF